MGVIFKCSFYFFISLMLFNHCSFCYAVSKNGLPICNKKVPYDGSQFVAVGYQNAGLEYNWQDTADTFPSGINLRHFSKVTDGMLQTGDVLVWKSSNPKTGKKIRHMLVYDSQAGINKNAWSALDEKTSFGAVYYQDYSKQFGFNPICYRYTP